MALNSNNIVIQQIRGQSLEFVISYFCIESILDDRALKQKLKDLSVSFSLIHLLPSEEAGTPCFTLHDTLQKHLCSSQSCAQWTLDSL